MKYDLNDFLIQPKITTTIDSRLRICPLDDNNSLPIFVSPMDTVVDSTNVEVFLNKHLNVCLPREEYAKPYNFIQSYGKIFKSYSLNKFIEAYLTHKYKSNNIKYILIDIANGHMTKLIDAVARTKIMYGSDIVLMVGNVANAETYKLLSEAGADYIRVGIGAGNACLTTANVAVGYPMGSLIIECRAAAKELGDRAAYIVADGGMRTYKDIIIALALGADYVMIGSLFNKCIESCGPNYIFNNRIKISKKIAEFLFKNTQIPIYKQFRGMSTKEVQRKWSSPRIKTSEGTVTYRRVETNVYKWVDNFKDYLMSAMSYSDALTLSDFIGKATVNIISEQTYNRFNK